MDTHTTNALIDAPRARLEHERLTHAIIGVFFNVHRELGFGFLESAYAEAFHIGLTELGLRVSREEARTVWFHGHPVGDFRADLIVEQLVVVELKTVRTLDPAHEAQLLNYLRATDVEVGLLFNFGPRAQFRRAVFSNDRKSRPSGESVGHDAPAPSRG